MEGILNILQTVSTNEKSLSLFVSAYVEHQSLQLKGVTSSDPTIQLITSLMSKPATRYQGFFILTNIFPQIPLDVVEQKGSLWATLSIKICSQKGADDVVSFAFRLIKLIALRSIEIPELTKSFASNIIGRFCETLNESSATGHLDALKCVETLLRIYPGPCSPVRGGFEKFILKFIDSSDETLINWCGKCYHLLQQVRGGGVEGLSQKMAWQFYQTKLIGSLHKTLDSIYANVSELYDEPIEKAQLKIPSLELSSEPIQKSVQLVTRFKNLLSFLSVALKEPFPVSKSVTPKKILNLISRTLAVNCKMLEKNVISDNLAIGALIPSFHVEIFKLLDSLILTIKSYLSPYYKEILGFVYDTLKWTSSQKSAGRQKTYINLRIAAYNTLVLWCTTMKFGSCVEVISQGIVEQIDYDITPFQNEFTLKVLSGAKRHMSKKARRQLHKVQNEQSNLVQTHAKASDVQNTKILFSDEGNQTLCCAALRCLKAVILSSSCFLKPTILKDIHNKIVTLAMRAPEDCSLKDKLYASYTCRLRLYEVLQSIVMAPNTFCPPPTQMALHILNRAQFFDIHHLVRETCFDHMKNLEKVIHPQKECMLFPPELREIKNAFSKYGRTLTVETPDQLQNNEDISSAEEESEIDDEEQDAEEQENEEVEEEDNEEEVEDQDNEEEVEEQDNQEEDFTQFEDKQTFDLTSPPRLNDESALSIDTIDLTNGEVAVEGLPHPKHSEDKVVEFPDSPVFVLHVDDDDSDVEMITKDDDINEPAAKKAKSNEDVTSDEANRETNDDYKNEFNKNDNEDSLLAEIAANFVDELN